MSSFKDNNSNSSANEDEIGDVENANNSNNFLSKVDGQVVLNAFDYASCCPDVVIVAGGDVPVAKLSKAYGNYLSEKITKDQVIHLCHCGMGNDTFPSRLVLEPRLREAYINVRDSERRRAHKIAMFQRHGTLSSIVMNAEESLQDKNRSITNGGKNNNTAVTSMAIDDDDDDERKIAKPLLTQREEIQNVRDIVKTFVNKHQKNLGVHPFLAGLAKLLEMQLQNSSKETSIARWTFRQVVLSEAIRGNDEYIHDAVNMLLSFLVRVKSEEEEHDLEASIPMITADNGTEEDIPDVVEKTMSWEIDVSFSNYQMQRILNLLPRKGDLHARPTGTIEVMEGEKRRTNIDGKLDDSEYYNLSWCTML
mmetsp:Transcript_2725/g.4179  ORF Transcript_2725/g.4179 Transcript_2725/m.4179 type:complete len:365 (+) Transcript_2725:1142-2236(+)